MKEPGPPTNGSRMVRDAIVMSGWTWETFNVPERISLAFAHLGARVLYCENPVSFFRSPSRPRQEVESRVYRTTLRFLGHRLNHIPFILPRLQSQLLTTQILRSVQDLRLEDPLFVYPHGIFASLCSAFKKRGFFLVHVCMDYPEAGQERLIELSNLTLVIPKSLYEGMRVIYGEKIQMIPQVGRLLDFRDVGAEMSMEPNDLVNIPRPRLGYIGPVDRRLDLRVLSEVLEAHPEWHMFHFGESKCLPLKNVHVLAWRPPEELSQIVAGLDLGFMPYARDDNKNLHCMPLKLFDYFALGKPVVSTRILNLLEFSETIYFGDNAGELCRAIQTALDEPPDSPLKSKRMVIGKENSIEALAKVLAEVLASCGKTADAVAT
jgi:glycosyltransferase involved in cell wall biosynthesis